MRVLIVEDDPPIGDGLACGLRQAGFAADWVTGFRDAEAALRSCSYDVIILDLGLPDGCGARLLRDFRARGGDAAVMILTARDTVADRVSGLDAGADDYVVKPFDLDEVCARVRALGRRRAGRARAVISHAGVTVDPATRQVMHEGREIPLSRREFDVLLLLLERKGKVVSRAALEQHVYDWSEAIASNTVEVHIHHLRRKLGAGLITTFRGLGYSFVDTP